MPREVLIVGSLLAPTLVLALIAIHEREHTMAGLTSGLPAAVRHLARREHTSSGGQNPSAVARARCSGNGALSLSVRRPARDSSCLGVKVGP